MIKIERSDLQDALAKCARVAGTNSVVPILSYVIVDAVPGKKEKKDKKAEEERYDYRPKGSGSLIFHASNLEIHIRTTKAAHVTKAVRFAMPIEAVKKAVRAMEPDEVEVTITLKQDGAERAILTLNDATFQTLPVDEFPVWPALEGEVKTMKMKGFATHINRVGAAAAKEEAAHSLNAVYLNFKDKTVAATDGHRLHISESFEWEGDAPAEEGMILSRPLIRLLPTSSYDTINMEYRSDRAEGETPWLRFTQDHSSTEIMARPVDGQFPNYSDVIPKAFTKIIRVPKDEMMNVVKECIPLSPSDFNAVSLGVIPERKELKVLSTNVNLGHNLARVKITDIHGIEEPFAISFNAQYLLDAMTNVKDKSVTISMNDETSPMVTRDTDYLAVVMPMRDGSAEVVSFGEEEAKAA